MAVQTKGIMMDWTMILEIKRILCPLEYLKRRFKYNIEIDIKAIYWGDMKFAARNNRCFWYFETLM
jgi:hypothetical protein